MNLAKANPAQTGWTTLTLVPALIALLLRVLAG